eukprot:NODE_949_length_2936_cov_0.479732.p2 type:complete len:237 gc:universal NODE_949_length_2936_cov_0.479732:846-1556(+)
MIFQLPITALPPTHTDLYETDADGLYSVTHDANICKFGGNEVRCNYEMLFSTIWIRPFGNDVEYPYQNPLQDAFMSAGIYPDGWYKLPNFEYSTPRPNIKSLDFQELNLCLVLDDGTVACGVRESVDSGSSTLTIMSGKDITDIRISQTYPYMCLINSNWQVWCMALGNGSIEQVFSSSNEWTQIESLTDTDAIRIDDTRICGHKKDDSIHTYYCVEIGTSFDPNNAFAEASEKSF